MLKLKDIGKQYLLPIEKNKPIGDISIMWTARETETIRQQIKMKLSQYGWYLGSYVVPDYEGYAIQVEVSRMTPDVCNLIPLKVKNTNIKVQIKSESKCS